jgi:preprotein translocase subunit SecF
MSFLKLSKLTLGFSALIVLVSVFLLFNPGPRLSIEFTGGTLMSVRLPEGKTKVDVETALQDFANKEALGNATVSTISGVQGDSILLRMKPISNEDHLALLEHLKTKIGDVQELQFNTIGPSVSASLKEKALISLTIASLAVIAYLAFSFRKLPKKLSPWKFGTLAVVAFLHDILITAGIFVIISRYSTFEVDTLFVTALLTILAYSVNDTIVIFDRIRSTLLEERKEDLEAATVRGLWECATRTLHTTMAGLIMLFAIFFLGSESIKWFILALIIGTFIGTYSSYFVAAPLLVFWSRKKN